MPVTDATSSALADRTFAAVVVETPDGSPPGDREVAHALDRLASCGVPIVVAPPAGLDRAVDDLAARGVTGDLVALLRAGPDRPADTLRAAVEAQVERYRAGRVPDVDDDPRWVVDLPADAEHRRVAEALGALANGTIGSRAALEDDGGPTPTLVAAGVYTREGGPRLVTGADWARLPVAGVAPGRRTLDLRTGVLRRADPGSGFTSLRFTSMARPTALALRAEGPTRAWRDEPPVTVGPPAGDGRGGIAVAARDRRRTRGELVTVDRLAAAVVDRDAVPSAATARAAADELADLGFERLLAEHRAAWADRWRDAEVTIEGSPADELAARFAVFHLLATGAEGDELAIGPRGLTGPAYGGHVFWDADVFVLPALAAIRPGAAAAMLAYRDHRIPAARAAAQADGMAGARFPWESAADGTEVTPPFVDAAGQMVPVLTDDHEEHIVADVAWAADRLEQWVGPGTSSSGAVRRILRETARYWSSRQARTVDPRHIRGVMGPDEYHDRVDDNAFTNVMARWNLRRAAQQADDPAEAARWRAQAEALVDGWDAGRGCHEQFAGYWDREPLLAEAVGRPPFAADLLLGAERVAGSQLVKQPDVLMLHHMVPDEVRPGSLAADLAVYGPRTVHGSSLSPAVHAGLHARASQPDRALALFRTAARLDLDDLTGTTASGLHLATMGGLWQALAQGFLGLRATVEGLALAPCLPDDWEALALRLRFRGRRLGVRADHEAVHVTTDGPLVLTVGRRVVRCEAPGTTVPLRTREDAA